MLWFDRVILFINGYRICNGTLYLVLIKVFVCAEQPVDPIYIGRMGNRLAYLMHFLVWQMSLAVDQKKGMHLERHDEGDWL